MAHASKDLEQHIATTSAPSRSSRAQFASTTVCGSAPDSRRLFLTGAKLGIVFICKNKHTSYDHPDETTPHKSQSQKHPPGAPTPVAQASNQDMRRLRWD